jgi:hypothetical protein
VKPARSGVKPARSGGKAARLLRWYPRAWRERYGEELLALIQDTVDEGRPTWRLRVGVIGGGLRERGHQAGRAAKAAVAKRATMVGGWLTILLAGLLFTNLPLQFKMSAPPGRAWQATAALDVVVAFGAFICVVLLVGGLAARPAVVRFLRAGGWPKIRRQVVWAAGATGLTAGALVAVFLGLRSQLDAPLNVSLPYFLGLMATALALVITIGLWAAVVAAATRHLKLAPRVRAVELVAGPVISTAVQVMVAASSIWDWAVQASVPSLVFGIGLLVALSTYAPIQLRQAVRKGRRLRAAASGATIVNPSARRTHGRHRA